MLSLLSPALAPVAPPTPPAANPRGTAGASGDAAPQDFAQALDQAVAAEPKAALHDPRGPARPVAAAKSAARAAAKAPAEAGKEPRLPATKIEPLPAQADGKTRLPLPPQAEGESGLPLPPQPEGKTELRLPPQAEGELDPQLPPQPEGKTDLQLPPLAEGESAGTGRLAAPETVGALLAELRAATGAASSAHAVDATAQPGEAEQTRSTGLRAIGASKPAAVNAPGQDTSDSAPILSRRDETSGAEHGRDSFAHSLAASVPADAPTAHSEIPSGVVPPTPLASAAAAPAAQAAQAEARLPATPGSADFGPQLGAQVATFVRAGVQHARLHLNPAEMGPVMVQIQLDGQTALVHLSAEQAHTRNALEQAMPQLASSLREAGLTLTGGGVSQQPQQGRDLPPDSSAAARSAKPGQPGERPQRTDAIAAVQRRRGVVDLIA